MSQHVLLALILVCVFASGLLFGAAAMMDT
jgi:hypothetical protein